MLNAATSLETRGVALLATSLLALAAVSVLNIGAKSALQTEPTSALTTITTKPILRDFTAVADMERARAGCDWDVVRASSLIHSEFSTKISHGPFFTVQDWLGVEENEKLKDLTSRSCTRPTERGTWMFEDVGPFKTVGASGSSKPIPQVYHHARWGDIGRFEGLTAKGEVIWVTAAAIRVFNETSDKPVGAPPIHHHHAHISVNSASRDYNTDRSLYFSGPDSSWCSEQEGGEGCSLEVYPEGFGYSITTSLHHWSTFDEVGAGYFPFRIEVTVRYELQSQRRVPLLALSRWWSYGPFCNVHDPNGDSPPKDAPMTHAIPPKAQSIFWYSWHNPSDAVVVRMYLHSHQEQLRRAFVFQSTPQQIGLDVGDFKLPLPHTLKLNSVSLNNIEDAEGYLMTNLARSAKANSSVELVCRLGTGSVEYVLHGGKAQPFARHATNMRCGDLVELKKGAAMTVVGIYDSISTPMDVDIPGHLHFWPIVHDKHSPHVSQHMNGDPDFHPFPPGCDPFEPACMLGLFRDDVRQRRALSVA